MTEEPRDLTVENALLRGTLWMTLRRLKDYSGAAHFEIEDDCDGTPMMEVIIPESLRGKAEDAVAKAEALLQGAERGMGR